MLKVAVRKAAVDFYLFIYFGVAAKSGGKSEYSAQFKGRRRTAAPREEGGAGGDFQIYCGKLRACRQPRACACVRARAQPFFYRTFSARA